MNQFSSQAHFDLNSKAIYSVPYSQLVVWVSIYILFGLYQNKVYAHITYEHMWLMNWIISKKWRRMSGEEKDKRMLSKLYNFRGKFQLLF